MDRERQDRGASGGAIVSFVHDRLREAILRCELGPGLPISQVKLAREFGISRTPLREVLRLLEREGLVESQHNHRFRVSGFSLDDLVEVYASRIMLETLATRQSMRSMSPVAVERLSEAYAGMAREAGAGDYDRWQVEHRRFHGVLNAGGGRRLVETVERLTDYADRYRRIYWTSAPLAWRSGLRQHERILQAATRFDADATANRVAVHLAAAATTLVRAVDPSHDVGLLEQALLLCGAELPRTTTGTRRAG